MYDTGINYLAVLVAAIASMILGYLWYGPLFGKQWMALSGMTKEQLEAGKAKGMTKGYVIGYIGSAVMAYVIAYLLGATGATSIGDAVAVAFWGWLGFVATVTLGTVLWENKPWSLWVLNNAYQLISAIVMAVILSAWQ